MGDINNISNFISRGGNDSEGSIEETSTSKENNKKRTSTPALTTNDCRKPFLLSFSSINRWVWNLTQKVIPSGESPEKSLIKPNFLDSKTEGAPPSPPGEDVEDMLISCLNKISLKDYADNQAINTDESSEPKTASATSSLDLFEDDGEEDERYYSAVEHFYDDDWEVEGENVFQPYCATVTAARVKSTKPNIANESLDPTKVKCQQYYEHVQRTVAMLAKTIEDMPMADKETDNMVDPEGLIPLFEHQRYGLKWLIWREQNFPNGGILADEMGLGKTVMIIALIMKSKMDGAQAADENRVDTEEVGDSIPSKGTLVVCPVGCILQWKEEINKKGKGLRVSMYYGPHRITSAAQLAQNDVVLTTYNTIVHDITKDGSRTKSPLNRIYWQRIVLDEAHYIRNSKTASSLSICQLTAKHRWAVTGTPVHNRPADFYSLVKFLRVKPFDNSKIWDFWIGSKTIRKSVGAKSRLHILGKALILRRTKLDVKEASGNIQKIPLKTIEVIELDMSKEEMMLYDNLKQFATKVLQQLMDNKEESDRQVNSTDADCKKLKDKGARGIQFSHIFTLLVRLRQCAVHPHLIQPMLDDKEIGENIPFDELNDEHFITKINPLFDRMYESTKIKRILVDLEKLRAHAKAEGEPIEKVVIVSQWTQVLEILYAHLRRMNFSCVFITGKQKSTVRADNMWKFNNYPEKFHICLLSLMAGGVGLNLIGGNHVFFIEPHWNPQLELQAQDRCHRIGQKKNVIVKRYIMKGTVESRITQIQEQKISLAEAVLDKSEKSRGGRLSVSQLKQLFQ